MDIELLPLSEQDVDLVRKWRNSPEVSKYMYTDHQITKEEHQNWFNYIQDNPTCKYWIIQYNEKKLGLANLTGINLNLQSCYWAFYLGETLQRGSGIGSKVEYNVLKYVFEGLKLHKLRCEVLVSNTTVIQMHEKFGFRREAYYRDYCFKNDKYEDVVGLAILKTEWEILKNFQHKKIYESK